MSAKQMKELKNLTKDELATKLRDSEKQLFEARMKKATGQLGDMASIWRVRKDIARMKGLLAELESAAAGARQKA